MKCSFPELQRIQAKIQAEIESQVDHEIESDSSVSSNYSDISESKSIPTFTAEKVDDTEKTIVQNGLSSVEVSDSEEEEEKRNPNYTPKGKSHFVSVFRRPEIQEKREKLPIFMLEQEIMDTINSNPVTVICGETGSGKTTQVPQFLFEAGYGNAESDNPGMIGVTQPRRVAAIAMAKRVADEMNLDDCTVAHQVRYDSDVKSSTAMKFMTDGILLKEISVDFLLKKYSVIIIDEAHERNINTDILIGLLSRVVRLRLEMSSENPEIKKLRVIIMSATLRVKDFTDNPALFSKPPPVLNVEARQFPVTNHFNRITNDDYVSEAFKKIVKIHSKLPEGGILVFMTGKSEILSLCEKLRDRYPTTEKNNAKETIAAEETEITFDLDHVAEVMEKCEDSTPRNVDDFEFEDDTSKPLHVLPLYSLLPSEEQAKVFMDPPEGTRLCVIATNIAETSITIPNIKYVVDCGKTKQRNFKKSTGTQSFDIDWISKASADQRAGRAGRVGPGHCYRLYSSAVFENEFSQFSIPEIKRIPLEGVVLLMKSMSIDTVVNFPFPTPPERSDLKYAERVLINLGALKPENLRATDLGKRMAMLPLSPRFSKILIESIEHNIFEHVLSTVAALSVGEIFSESEKKRNKFSDPISDLLMLRNVIDAGEKSGDLQRFCRLNNVRFKAMQEVSKLKTQLRNIIASICQLPKESKEFSRKRFCQVFLTGFVDHVATLDTNIESKYPVYRTMYSDEPVFIHPSSNLFSSKAFHPFLMYDRIVETKKKYMKEVTVIDQNWIGTFGRTMCEFGKPADSPPPSYNEARDQIFCHVEATFGPKMWKLGLIRIPFPVGADKYRYFAKLLLEGEILPEFTEYKDHLISNPSMMLKSWKMDKIDQILHPLIKYKIASKRELFEKWEEDSLFLLSGYLLWIPVELRSEVQSKWPFK